MSRRVLLGKEGSNYVLKVSKPGVDVIDDSIASRDYLFNSEVYRAGVLRANTAVTTMSTAGTPLPTTSDSSGTAYIPAYVITEKGVVYPQAQFDQTQSTGNGFNEIYAVVKGCNSTAAGGGMFEFSTTGSGTNKNVVKPIYVKLEELNDPRPGETTGYPYLTARTRASSDGTVNLQVLGIPCQFGKMVASDSLFGNSVLTGSNTGENGSSGATAGPPTISGITLNSRNTTNDVVTVGGVNGSNNTATKTFGQSTSNSSSGVTFQSSAQFNHSRGTTKFYFVKQNNLFSVSTGTAHIYASAAVDTTPDAFTFAVRNNATAGQNFSQASSQIAGLATGDSAAVSVSNGSVNVSTVVNGGTVTATGTAASAGGTSTVTVTIGGVSSNFVINTAGVVPDTTPSAFGNFTAVGSSELNTVNTSNNITIQDINTATSVSISSGGTFSIAGGSYVTSGNVTNGQTISVKLTSSGSFSTAVSTTLTVGGVSGSYTVTTRGVAAATQPTGLTLTQTTNTSGSGQTVTATGSGGAGTIQVSNDGSNYQSNGHGFTQNRSGSATTYYTRAVTGDQTSSARTATKVVPPVVSGVTANVATDSLVSGGVNHTYSPGRGAGFTNYAAYWGTVSTSISDNASWLTTSIANSAAGTFTVNTSANSSTSARSAVVTYTTTTQFGHQHVFSYTFTQAGLDLDSTPNQFTFGNETSANLGQTYTKNDTLSGMNTTATAVYSGDSNGSFSIDGSTFNQSNKTVQNGTVLYLRIPASGSFSTARSGTVTVNGIANTMTITTEAQDTDVNNFDSFQDETGANTNTVSDSNSVTVNGFNGTLVASFSTNGISGFKVGSGSYSTANKNITNGQTITMFIRSSGSNSTTTTSTVTVGNKSGTYRVTTTGGGGGGEGGGLE